MVRITSFTEHCDAQRPDWEAARLHYNTEQNKGAWIANADDTKAFSFAIPNRDSFMQDFRHTGIFEESFAKFGDPYLAQWLDNQDCDSLGGLSLAGSPMLCGTADLRLPKEHNSDRLTLLAWRRADGELLIYRRSFPAK